MAKKKPKKVSKPPAKKKAAAKVEAPPTIVVFYELRDVASVRYHSEHADIVRARIAAQTLVTSPDVNQAWIVRDVEIVRSPGGW